jgi:ribosomal protein L40E
MKGGSGAGGAAVKPKRKPETFVCPHCGADVAVGASACRECGSDDETGWSEGAGVWAAGIPTGYGDDDDFDDDDFVRRELPRHANVPFLRSLKEWAWRAIVVVVCLALLRYLIVR